MARQAGTGSFRQWTAFGELPQEPIGQPGALQQAMRDTLRGGFGASRCRCSATILLVIAGDEEKL